MRPFINWRAFSFTSLYVVLLSLLWEVTLALPVACDTDAGFHMARLWEILDVSNLRYATNDDLSPGFEVLEPSDDSKGPPACPR